MAVFGDGWSFNSETRLTGLEPASSGVTGRRSGFARVANKGVASEGANVCTSACTNSQDSAHDDPLETPEEVYSGRVKPRLPRWQGWAKAARQKLDKLMPHAA